MGEAIGDGGARRRIAVRPVHRLQREALETQVLEAGRIDAGLRIDQLELLAGGLRERRVGSEILAQISIAS